MKTRYTFHDYYRYAYMVHSNMLSGWSSRNTIDFEAMLAYHLWETNADLVALIDKELLALPEVDDDSGYYPIFSWKELKKELIEKCKQT